jgi:serine protease AprX
MAGRELPERPDDAPVDSVLAALLDPATRRRLGMAEDDRTPLPVVVELNEGHEEGREGAVRRFHELYREVAAHRGAADPVRVGRNYDHCQASIDELRRLVVADLAGGRMEQRAIVRVWPDFPVQAMRR